VGASGHDVGTSRIAAFHLTISAIGVNASVENLGLNLDGTLHVPTNFSRVGWWSGGSIPGNPGPAVFVGHVSSIYGPGVFYRLHELHRGDRIVVLKPSGEKVVFTVTKRQFVPKSDFPTMRVYAPTRGAEIRLITCGGRVNQSTGHFDENLIVFGVRDLPLR
jgi:hypothetical protein